MAFNIPMFTNMSNGMSTNMSDMSSPALMPKPHQFRDIRITKVASKTASFLGQDVSEHLDQEAFGQAPLSKLDLAANKISFSTALLRSYGKVYESLGGRLAHDSQGIKIYGDELLETFKQVREQVHEGHPIQDAMKLAFESDKGKSKSKTKPRSKEAQPVDKKKLSQLLQSNAVLSEEIQDLRRELKHLKKDKKDKKDKSGWLSKLVRVVY